MLLCSHPALLGRGLETLQAAEQQQQSGGREGGLSPPLFPSWLAAGVRAPLHVVSPSAARQRRPRSQSRFPRSCKGPLRASVRRASWWWRPWPCLEVKQRRGERCLAGWELRAVLPLGLAAAVGPHCLVPLPGVWGQNTPLRDGTRPRDGLCWRRRLGSKLHVHVLERGGERRERLTRLPFLPLENLLSKVDAERGKFLELKGNG